MDLRTQIERLSVEMKSKLPESASAVMTRALNELKASELDKTALKPGDKCPDFTLPNVHGLDVTLKHLLKHGPVVLVFYRGGWCPYCNLTLRALQQSLGEISEAGAQLVAVSPQKPDQSLSTVEKDQLSFEVLSDRHNNVAKSFGLVFKLSSDLISLYGELGIDLKMANGDEHNELPLAATYIVWTDGIIAHAFVDVDYKHRMEPNEIVAVVKKLFIAEAARTK